MNHRFSLRLKVRLFGGQRTLDAGGGRVQIKGIDAKKRGHSDGAKAQPVPHQKVASGVIFIGVGMDEVRAVWARFKTAVEGTIVHSREKRLRSGVTNTDITHQSHLINARLASRETEKPPNSI